MKSLDREAAYFFHTYKRIPLEIDRGEGVYLFTKDGKRYLDMFAGLAVNALGYSHPKIIEAIGSNRANISTFPITTCRSRKSGWLNCW